MINDDKNYQKTCKYYDSVANCFFYATPIKPPFLVFRRVQFNGIITSWITINLISQGLINALQRAWPESRCLQCQWHILQASWRWLCSSDNLVKREHRQELHKLFKNVIYAKTRLEFEEHQELFEGAEVSKKYPHYLAHVTKDYGYRVETWATYFRIENELPTRGSNTNNYCESSMRLTKEKVFSRIRTFNLPEMLSVICDNSVSYANKLVDIGDGRDTALKQGKSKYLEKISTIRKEEIVEETFILERATN